MERARYTHEGVEQPWDVGEAIGAAWRGLRRMPFVTASVYFAMLIVSPGFGLFARQFVVAVRVQGHHGQIAAAPHGLAFAYRIDDDRAHDLRCVGEEGLVVLDAQLPGLQEAQVRLVDERGGLEKGVASTATKPGAGELAQLGIRRLEQLVASAPITRADLLDQLCQAAHAAWPPVDDGCGYRRSDPFCGEKPSPGATAIHRIGDGGQPRSATWRSRCDSTCPSPTRAACTRSAPSRSSSSSGA